MSDYQSIKQRLSPERKLFEDPEFPASRFSLKRDGTGVYGIRWKRPKEMVSNPVYIRSSASRFDLHQGEIGNCWFVAAVASLSLTNREMFKRCVPHDQDFTDTDYCGIFRFKFWKFDRWIEVVVDDRLPVNSDGTLIYGKNKLEPNEFWFPLLEKAYAKLYGCYQHIGEGGYINDALVDMTGGISEFIPLSMLRDAGKIPPDLFVRLYRTMRMNSMSGASIDGAMEGAIGNGLYSGHAYSITSMAKVKARHKLVELVRLRNPWGQVEWSGAWSDKSGNWNDVDQTTKDELGYTRLDEGEFWMSFEDFIEQFHWIHFCHLVPDSVTDEVAKDMNKVGWECVKYHDEWVRGINSGGCGNPPHQDLFWRNPQFFVTMTSTDDDDNDGKCTMIVSLMQKTEDYKFERFIYLKVYKIQHGVPAPKMGDTVDKKDLIRVWDPPGFFNQREVTAWMTLDPGIYVIIPCTLQVDIECDFYLRIFSEKTASSHSVTDSATEIELTLVSKETETEKIFRKYTNSEMTMDAAELCVCLNQTYNLDIDRGTARSIVAMHGSTNSGTISYNEFERAMQGLNVWKDKFDQADANGIGSVDSYSMRNLFSVCGFRLSKRVFSAVVKDYGGKKRSITFEDFVHVCSKITTLYGEFVNRSDEREITIDLDQFLLISLKS